MKTTNTDYSQFLAMIAFVLIGIGIVFVCSAQADVGDEFSLRRVYFSIGGVVAIVLFSFVPYKFFSFPSSQQLRNALACLNSKGCRWKGLLAIFQYSILPGFILVVFGFLLYILVGDIEAEKGSRRWVSLFKDTAFHFKFQPSELTKLAVVFFEASYIVYFGHILQKLSIINIARGMVKVFDGKLSVNTVIKQLLLAAPFFAVPAIFIAIIAVEDFGTAAFIAIITFVMLLIARTPYWILFAGAACGAGGAYFYISQEQYRINRIIAFMDLEKASDAIKYQIVNSMTAISTGGIFGKGLGRGVYKWGYLPEDKTDFIFAIICEEIGVVGAIFVIFMYLMILVLGFVIAFKCRDLHGRFLAIGLASAITLQAFVNIGVVTSSLPTTGIPLPFVSAGGSSMVTSAFAIGLLMNIARKSAKTELNPLEDK